MGLGLSASAIGALLAACGVAGKKAATYSPSPMATALPKKLSLWNWTNYMAPGLKEGFARKYGVEVVEHSFDAGESLPDLFSDPNVHMDLMVLADYMVHILGNDGDLVPLDLRYVPNAAQTIPKLEHPPFDAWPDGRRYSVPYQWGVTGIGHRTDVLPAQITGWADMWNPAFSQKIQMLNDEREVLGAALKKDGHSLNTLVQGELDTAINDLIKQKPLVRAYDSISPKSAMIKGMALTQCWSGDVIWARRAGLGPDELHFVLPEEGYGVWVDNICVHKGARNPYAAHLFMNYVCDPAVNAKLTNWTGCFSPIAAATPLVDGTITALSPSAANLERGEIFNDLGEFAANYATAWQTVKGA